MYDAPKIIIGVILFLAVFSLPFYYSQVSGDADYEPHYDTSLLKADGITQCVKSADYMAAKHMDLLDNWRHEVVRNGERSYESEFYDEPFDKSLTDTCLEQCHDNKSDFCDQCHDYVAVSPKCWDCHNIVEGE